MAITAASWKIIGAVGLDQAIDATSTTQVYKTGKVIRCRDVGAGDYGEAEFIYAKGVASVAVGDVCMLSTKGDPATRTVARTKGPLGVAQAAIVASNWGWFQIYGTATVNVLASFADDVQVYLTSTAGSVDDAVVAGDLIYGARSAGAIDTGQALIELSYPYAGDTDNT